MATRGRAIVETSSLDEIASIAPECFGIVDALAQLLLEAAFRPAPLVESGVKNGRGWARLLIGDESSKAFLERHYSLAVQQQLGAWFLPEEVRIEAGVLNLPGYFRETPRFAAGRAADQRVTVPLSTSADALFLWAVAEPLITALLKPILWRSTQPLKGDRADQKQAWEDYRALLTRLEITHPAALRAMEFGSGWGRLRAPAQAETRLQFLQELSGQLDGVAHRFRASSIQDLCRHYYEKFKRKPPKRRAVVTAPYRRILSGYFSGGWLSFLEFIGEQPHPDEEVVTGLPDAKLHVAGREQAVEVAAKTGMSVETVAKVLAAGWGGERSPVHERIDAMLAYWAEFDAIHTRHRPGMGPLWGLVDDGFVSFVGEHPVRTGLFQELLSPALLGMINRCWGTTVLRKWPERIVSEPHPHALFAHAFGPALELWHGVALTTWFVCEGPRSRTDLAGLEHYYRKQLHVLAGSGHAVDSSLFEELKAAESRLGPEQALTRDYGSVGEGDMQVSFSMSYGSRRDGFELVRDIVTRHRRAWAAQYLEAYLRNRWESELRQCADTFAKYMADKGRPPTLKQFLKHAEQPARHWFGGSIAHVYRAIGESSPLSPNNVASVPADRIGIARSVFNDLMRAQRSQPGGDWNAQYLAGKSLVFLQLEEAMGRPPTRDEFGATDFEHYGSAFGETLDAAWSYYVSVIRRAVSAPTPAPPAPPRAQPPPPVNPPLDQGPSAQQAPEGKGLWASLRRLFKT